MRAQAVKLKMTLTAGFYKKMKKKKNSKWAESLKNKKLKEFLEEEDGSKKS